MALKRVNAVNSAAAKWKVPPEVLWGVYGVETQFGANVSNSSKGAMGHFQFMPATAASYGYPMTNKPTQAQFNKQAEAAAHLLADNYKRYGTWDRAIHAYSSGNPTGGYGLKEVRKKIADNPGVFTGSTGDIPGPTKIQRAAAGPLGDAANVTFDGMKAIGAFFLALMQGDTWLRIGKVLGGGILLYLALHNLGMIPAIKPKVI